MIILIFLIILIPVAMAAVSLFRIKVLPQTVNDYFTAEGEMDEISFVDTSVAYAYQIAAISLFAFWGFEYGIWTIWVPVFWGFGYLILIHFSKKGYITKFIDKYTGDTIHGLLKNHYNLKIIAVVAGLASMLGLAGTAFFEAEFTSNIIVDLLQSQGNSNITTFNVALGIFIFFVLVALVYVVIGGQRAVVKTDSKQLRVGFVLFMIFLGATLGFGYARGFTFSSLILFVFSLLLLVFLIFLFYRMSINLTNKKGISTAFIIGVISFATFYVICANLSNIENITFDDNLTYFLTANNAYKPFILGFPALISLFIAKASWQIIDVSNWERISSIRNRKDFTQKLNSSLKYIGIYSPITWVLSIILGMGLKMAVINSDDSYNSLSNILVSFLNNENLLLIAVSLIMLTSMTLIMFSTLDSLILGISFTVQKDILGLKDNPKGGLSKFKIGTVIITLLLLAFYLFSRSHVSEIDSILYTFYAFQIGLLPAVYFALTSKSNNKIAALLSIFAGIVTPIIVLTYGISPYDWTAFATFLSSFAIFYLVLLINFIYKFLK